MAVKILGYGEDLPATICQTVPAPEKYLQGSDIFFQQIKKIFCYHLSVFQQFPVSFSSCETPEKKLDPN